MFNYYNPTKDASIYFDDAPVGVLNSPQIERPSRQTVGRYVNILLDECFKKILGAKKNKDILLKILQELIPERQIVDIRYDTKKKRKSNVFEGCHDAVFDVECVDSNKARFVVEMQKSGQAHFHERALFYSTFPLQEQVIARGKEARQVDHDLHFDYQPVYVVSFLNFSFHPLSEQIVYRYGLRELDSGELMTDRVNFIFLEMTNYKRGNEEPHADDSFAEKLSWAFTHMSSLTERPASLMEEVFAKIFEACEVSAMNEDKETDYSTIMTTQWDIEDKINGAFLEGREEGREEGEKKAAVRIATNMIRAQKMAPEIVAALTGLSLEAIATL